MPLALKTCATLSQAAAALGEGGTRYVGGGTLAVRAVNEGDVSFSTLVRSTDPALSAIEVEGDRATLGASVTMSAIVGHPGLSAIAGAARAVGGPAIRNMATVGGNLFAPAPYGDFAVALLALDAVVHTTAGDFPIEDFLARRGGGHAGIVVASVSFEVPPAQAFRFAKVSRVKPKGVSVLSIAAILDVVEGTARQARIALGCMADGPFRARAAEKALAGATLTEEGVAPAVAAISEGIQPITDAIASAWYRAEVLPVHFRRLLLE